MGKIIFLILVPMVLLLFASSAFGTQHVIGSADLPYIVHSNDTVTFDSDHITSATDGIYIQQNAVNVLIDLQDDTLTFGTDNSYLNFGIRVGRSASHPGQAITGTMLYSPVFGFLR